MNQTIPKANSFRGTVSVPGDKSISHRALLLGALAKGTTRITGLSHGQDVMSTLACLRKMGIRIDQSNGVTVVHGKGLSGLSRSETALDAGNSGTTIRLLSGILAAQPFRSVIKGDASLSKRPMNRIIQPLSLMGADIHANEGGFPPLQIQGTTLRPIDYVSPVASAQIKSCILLAGLFINGTTSVTEPQQSRDHTERMFPCFEIPVEKEGLTVRVNGPAKLRAASIDIPGDISSAAFYMIAAMLIQNSNLTIRNIGINPTRTGLIHVLEQMGARIRKTNVSDANGEPRADLIVTHNQLHGTNIGSKHVPLLIDEIPILAIAATQAEGRTTIRDAKELRVKESDRIDAIEKNLKSMGVEIETFEDGFSITGPQSLKGAHIESFGDHRIAMAFSIAGLLADGKTVIQNSECAQISYPAFFETLKQLSNG